MTIKNKYEEDEYELDEIEEETDDDSEDDDSKIKEVNEEILVEKYSKGQLRIVRTTMDFSLHNLKQIFGDTQYLNMAPSYQRRNRWDNKKKSLLIESFLMNIPIPPIFLFEKDYNSYEVMDGRQRLQTINEFIENKFSLSSLEYWVELNGKKFNQLPLVLQRGLLRRTISSIVLLAESSRPEESEVDVRMVLFKRLNTGGIQLNPQELRNALYPSLFNDLILELSRLSIFTEIWSIPPKTINEDIEPPQALLKNQLYRSMADCELVLRFFAIRETIERDLKGSFKKLLDNCMIGHLNDNQELIDYLRFLFIDTITKLNKIFNSKPFILPNLNRPSAPLYDALMVAHSFIDDESKFKENLEINNSLINLLSDKKSYEILTGRGNTVNAIKDRVKLAKFILMGEA